MSKAHFLVESSWFTLSCVLHSEAEKNPQTTSAMVNQEKGTQKQAFLLSVSSQAPKPWCTHEPVKTHLP